MSGVRWFFLIGAVMSFLQATLLHSFFHRYVLAPWLGKAGAHGGGVPDIIRDPRFQRVWPLLMTALFGFMWWYTGTPVGRRFFQ